MISKTATILFLLIFTACGLLDNQNDDPPEIPGKIVFSADDDNGTPQIYTMNADGSDVKKLTDFPPEGGAADPAWSPDGERIAFANYTEATTLGPYLYLMNADGSGMRPLKRMQRESPKALIGSAPHWSPDGTKIAYQVCTNCERDGDNYEISTVEVTGEDYDPDQIHAVTNHPASRLSFLRQNGALLSVRPCGKWTPTGVTGGCCTMPSLTTPMLHRWPATTPAGVPMGPRSLLICA